MNDIPEAVEWLYNQNRTALVDRIGRLRAELEAVKASREGCVKDGRARQVESDRWKVEAREQMKRAEAAESELARLKDRVAGLELDVRVGECLQVSSYRAGLKAGWNFCDADEQDGYDAAMRGTEHIAELKRIREERKALTTDNPGGGTAREGGE